MAPHSAPLRIMFGVLALAALSGCPIGADPTDVTSGDGGAPDRPVGSVRGGAIADKCKSNGDCASGEVCAADVPGGGYCTRVCTSDANCPGGSACAAASASSKVCLKTCQGATSCRAEHLCSSGLCLPRCTSDDDCPSGACDRTTGQCGMSRVSNACQTDQDCGQSPAFCDRTNADGYCSLPCGGAQNVSCPGGSNCTSGGGCVLACNSVADCRSGLICAAGSGGVKSCLPRCVANQGCGPGLRCDTGSGLCVAGGPVLGTLGGACTADDNCAGVGTGAACLTDAAGFPKGYCSITCLAGDCPGDGTCVEFANMVRACLTSCTSAADCRAEYACLAFNSSNGVCIPRCLNDADCNDPTLVCDTSGGLCVPKQSTTTPPPPPGTPDTGDVVDLTPTPVTVTKSRGALLSLAVPADAVSITFVGQAVSDPTARLVVVEMDQSDDDFATSTRVFEFNSLSSQVHIEPSQFPGIFAALYPNSPLAPFTPSTATTTVKVGIKMIASSTTTATVKALIRRAPSRALTAGQIDLNLFFVGVANLDAATARSDARFQQILDSVRTVWGKAGLTIGKVNYIDIGGADAANFADLPIDNLGDLVSLSANPAAQDQALNVFFVNTITGGARDGYIVLGVAAGLPGVPIRGSAGSGMAVTSADFPKGLDQIAHVWAHEGAHWLGLFHVTEATGDAFNPLPDTPECPRAQFDADGSKLVDPEECVGHGADNLMFWAASDTMEQSTVTANQSFVVLRNAVTH